MLQDIFVIEYSPFWYRRSLCKMIQKKKKKKKKKKRSLCKFIGRPLHIMVPSSFVLNQTIFSWSVGYINLIVKLLHVF